MLDRALALGLAQDIDHVSLQVHILDIIEVVVVEPLLHGRPYEIRRIIRIDHFIHLQCLQISLAKVVVHLTCHWIAVDEFLEVIKAKPSIGRSLDHVVLPR